LLCSACYSTQADTKHLTFLKITFKIREGYYLRSLPEVKIPSKALSLDNHLSESEVLDGALRINRWGQWKWPLVMSTPERAYLELLDELPQKETFHMADVIMEGLVNLSPRRMQSLLENCNSVKVKRMLVKGGKLDTKY